MPAVLTAFRHRLFIPAVVALVAVLAAGAFMLRRAPDAGPAERLGRQRPGFSSNDPIERACALKPEWLRRIARGHVEGRSEDLTLVPRAPNYSGTFDVVSHSGPWDYLQKIPLVLYGPGRIASGEHPSRPVGLKDVYPSVGSLLRARLPERAGRPLSEALEGGAPGAPKLVVTVVWDGVGTETLELWPGRWPTLERLAARGTTYLNATAGSSPSITPATHSTLGTGVFPRVHRVPAIELRRKDGNVVTTFRGNDLSELERTTFADEFDRARGNEPKVGLIGWNPWHIGMMGHGALTPGSDADQLAIIDYKHPGRVTGNAALYATPPYLDNFPSLEEHAHRLDLSDGRADHRWLGDEILARDDNPAWVDYQSDLVLAMLEREGYGADDVPDLFFANFYPSDAVGHFSSIDSKRTAAVLEAQDAALARLVEYLEQEVNDYVLVVTADHGHTRSARSTGAWPIAQGELISDIDERFNVPKDETLVEESAAFGLFLDRSVMNGLGVNATDIARYVNNYTIRDNWDPKELPSGYEGRADEEVFSAAWPSARLNDVIECATQ
ncbi:MAG: alkaline phosphatase family protein [Actinomycetota bacterium]